MILSLNRNELITYYYQQLNNFFPDQKLKKVEIELIFDTAIDRLNYCFKHVSLNRYFNGKEAIYNHLYADHNLVFNWFLSNEVFKNNENTELASKLYYLNKVMHGFDCMYDTQLPDIFLIFHGVGTMLGKASYNDFFVALQGCTVGSHKGKYPIFGKGVALTSNSSVIGNCMIGDCVNISTRTTVFERNIESHHSIFVDGLSGKTVIKNSSLAYAQQFYNVEIKSQIIS